MNVGQVLRVLRLYNDTCRIVVVLNEAGRLLIGTVDTMYVADEKENMEAPMERAVALRGHVIATKE